MHGPPFLDHPHLYHLFPQTYSEVFNSGTSSFLPQNTHTKKNTHKNKNIKTTHVWSNKKRSFLLLLHRFSFLPDPTPQGRRLGRFPDGCARRRADLQRRQRGAGAVAGAFVAIQRAQEVLVMLQGFTQLTSAVFLVAGAKKKHLETCE